MDFSLIFFSFHNSFPFIIIKLLASDFISCKLHFQKGLSKIYLKLRLVLIFYYSFLTNLQSFLPNLLIVIHLNGAFSKINMRKIEKRTTKSKISKILICKWVGRIIFVEFKFCLFLQRGELSFIYKSWIRLCLRYSVFSLKHFVEHTLCSNWSGNNRSVMKPRLNYFGF